MFQGARFRFRVSWFGFRFRVLWFVFRVSVSCLRFRVQGRGAPSCSFRPAELTRSRVSFLSLRVSWLGSSLGAVVHPNELFLAGFDEEQGQGLVPRGSCFVFCAWGDRRKVGWLKRGRETRQEDVERSPTQSRISPSMQRLLRFRFGAHSDKLLLAGLDEEQGGCLGRARPLVCVVVHHLQFHMRQ